MAESKSESLSPTLDPESHYYLHPDLQPENKLWMVILSKADDNYFMWKRDVLASLQIRNKTGFVDGSIARPDPSSPLYDAWEQCNRMVMGWLLCSVSKELQRYVFSAKTAHGAWEEFRRIFVPCPELKIYELRQKIALMFQGGDSVSSYYGKLNLAWQELSEYYPVPECVCGGCQCDTSKRAKELRDREKIFEFMVRSTDDLSIKNSIADAFNVDWRRYQLRGTIAMLRQRGSSLASYFEKLDLAWQELSEYDPLPDCSCSGCRCEVAERAREAREREKVFGFLMGVDEELTKLTVQIKLMKPLPSFNQAYSILVVLTPNNLVSA